ncbi:MAG: flagellar hook-associated protein FlgK [Pseudomonadota bacterium]
MASGLLDIGSSALLSYQRALDTIGHNVANVNTPGYSRQRVELAARLPQGTGAGYIGNGVDVITVKRSYNQFISDELRSNTTSFHDLDIMASMAGRLDDLLADENSGLTPVLGSFFDAVQGVANDPASNAARQVLLSEADALASRFQGLDKWMTDSRRSLGTQMAAKVEQINRLAGSIASVNQQIIDAQSAAGGQPPNDLLDSRDQLVLQLSEYVALTTTSQDDGAMNVFIGNGQSLVLGVRANTVGLVERSDDPGQYDITIGVGGAQPITVTGLITGGELGGLLRYRDQVLDPAVNALGRIGVELATFMNEQHRAGVSLNGLPGQEMFSVTSPQVVADANTTGSISVSFDDVSKLTTDDYHLSFDGSGWALTRSGSGQAVPLSGSGTVADPFVAEGVSIVVGSGAAAGDGYTIRPVRNGAGDFRMLIENPRDLALAAPVRTSAALANAGTGQISAGTVTDIDNAAFQTPPGTLNPSVLVHFTSPTAYEIVDQSTSAVIDSGTYDPASGADIFPTATLGVDYGYRVRITGNPAAGDEFNVTYNSNGTGDNRNALLMAGLQTERLMAGGTLGFNDAYGEMVADVGSATHQAQVSSDVQRTVLEQSQSAWSEASGVNLDEEAADMVRYQQAYQAAAQVLSVASQLFDSLINAVRS